MGASIGTKGPHSRSRIQKKNLRRGIINPPVSVQYVDTMGAILASLWPEPGANLTSLEQPSDEIARKFMGLKDGQRGAAVRMPTPSQEDVLVKYSTGSTVQAIWKILRQIDLRVGTKAVCGEGFDLFFKGQKLAAGGSRMLGGIGLGAHIFLLLNGLGGSCPHLSSSLFVR